LDRFKRVNDTLGHAVGDRLLVGVAARLRNACRKEDTVARLGGDEFAILATMFAASEEVETMARKLQTTLSEPIDLAGTRHDSGASIGVCLFPKHATTSHEALLHADTAMYAAKQGGRGRYHFYAR
jgi:diguanylate cyclase (GGDEF)-like protein